MGECEANQRIQKKMLEFANYHSARHTHSRDDLKTTATRFKKYFRVITNCILKVSWNGNKSNKAKWESRLRACLALFAQESSQQVSSRWKRRIKVFSEVLSFFDLDPRSCNKNAWKTKNECLMNARSGEWNKKADKRREKLMMMMTDKEGKEEETKATKLLKVIF